MRLLDLNSTFSAVRRTGANGERLLSDAIHIIQSIDALLATFDEGLADENWATNMEMFGGSGTGEYALAFANILRDAKAEIEALG